MFKRNAPTTARALRRRTAALAAGAVVVTVVATAGGAHAANPTAQTGVLETVTNGTRTLALTDAAGAPLSAASNLVAATPNTPFGVQVTDASHDLTGFQVYSTLSNLYGYSNGTYTCGTKIPSSGVAASVLGSTVESNVNAVLNPVFHLTGNVTAIAGTLQTQLGGVLGTVGSLTGTGSQTTTLVTTVNTTVEGSLPAGTSLDLNTLLGKTVPGLVNGLLGALPIQATANTIGVPYAAPDVAPTGSGCTDVSTAAAAAATQVPLMVGATNVAGLLAAINAALAKANATLTNVSSGVPLSTLVNAGILTNNQAAAALGAALSSGTPIDATTLITDLGGTASGSTFETLLSDVTGTLTSVVNTANSALGPLVSGNYSNSPSLTVNPGSAPAGTYRGEMTVTLMDTPSGL